MMRRTAARTDNRRSGWWASAVVNGGHNRPPGGPQPQPQRGSPEAVPGCIPPQTGCQLEKSATVREEAAAETRCQHHITRHSHREKIVNISTRPRKQSSNHRPTRPTAGKPGPFATQTCSGAVRHGGQKQFAQCSRSENCV